MHVESDTSHGIAGNHHFKGKDWNFLHRDSRQRQLQFTAGSKTLEKKRTEKTRLPAAMYDVPAA